MRSIRVSTTFAATLDDLLARGEPIYGAGLIKSKRLAVRATLLLFADFPLLKRPHPTLGLVVYTVPGTPFVVLYDFDDHELRVHFIFQKSASLDELDPRSAQW